MVNYDLYGIAYVDSKEEADKYKVEDRRPTHFIKNEAYKKYVETYGSFINMYSKIQGRYILPIGQHRPVKTPKEYSFDIHWFTNYEYQDKVIAKARECLDTGKKGLFVVSGTATGKCHRKWTGIIMSDWKIKKVEDIVVGDTVMWIDSAPRKVVGTWAWVDTMYEISPIKWESFVVNSEHILSLVCNAHKFWWEPWQIINVSVNDYLQWNKTRKHITKLYRPNGFDLPEKELPLDPYFLWLWLGDWSSRDSAIHNPDIEIHEWLKKFCKDSGYRMTLKYYDDKTCPRISFKTIGKEPIGSVLRNMGVLRDKHIPDIYLYNSRDNRLKLLAGLIDSDWYLWKTGDLFFSTIREDLCEAVIYLCRSLWLAAYKKVHKKYCQTWAFCIEYWVSISWDFSIIPTKVKRKSRAVNKRKMNKDVLRVWFSVKELPPEKYYGFELDWDHLYMIDSFIVNHNTKMVLWIIQTAGLPTILVVPNTAVRNVNVREISQFTSCIPWVGGETPTEKANVYVMTSKTFNLVYEKVNGSFDILLIDESHRLPPTRVSQINQWKWCFVCWLTATPYRKEFSEEWFKMLFGEYFDTQKTALSMKIGVYRYERDYEMSEAISAAEGYAPESNEILRNLVINDEKRMDALMDVMNKLWKLWYRRYIVFSDRVDHIEKIYDRIAKSIPYTYHYYGSTSTEAKKKVEEEFHKQPYWVIVGHPESCGEWFNVPSLEVAIMFTSTSWEGRIEQIAGRVRRYSGEKNHWLLVDFADFYRIAGSKKKAMGFYNRSKIYQERWRETFNL